MFHAIVAEVALVLHAAFLVYLVAGGFLAWRWPRTIWLHLAVAAWGVGSVVVGYDCPLTGLETWARERAGGQGLPPEGFIEHYLTGVVYPEEHLRLVQALVFLVVVASWVGCVRRARRVRRARQGPQPVR